MRFQLHTLQLLPGAERPSYAEEAVEVLEGLDGRLSGSVGGWWDLNRLYLQMLPAGHLYFLRGLPRFGLGL